MKQFEYTYYDNPSIMTLNKMGEDGWELVAVYDNKTSKGIVHRHVFKLEKSS